MKVLAIETSCDETGAAVVEKNGDEQNVRVLSNVTATSLAIHAKTGGIIPENAAREQVKYIIPTIIEALLRSDKQFNNLTIQQFNHLVWNKNLTAINREAFEQASSILKTSIDSIAVTHGPGLIGSLLVGVETAKTLSFVFNKPLIPVNHLLAHIFANFIQSNSNFSPLISHLSFPFIGLIVSGGHTDLLLFKSLTNFKWLGGTRDDAAGEALDKIGRLLNLSYPAGPEIEQRAKNFLSLSPRERVVEDQVRGKTIQFHSPLLNSDDFDFSFSGLKAEVSRFVQTENPKLKTENLKNEICFAVQKAIIDVLVKKTVRAAKMFGTKQILLGGGVSANRPLLKEFKSSIEVFSPEKTYCTDNAAMIGSYALLNYKPVPWQKISSNPELYFV